MVKLLSGLLVLFSTLGYTQSSSYTVNADVTEDNIVLSWDTDFSMFIVEYELQKLNTENEWVNIWAIPATNAKSYVFTDNNPFIGLNSYRLRAVEASGQPHLSEVKVVNYDPAVFMIQVYPNPASNQVVASSNQIGAAFNVKMLNRFGTVVLESKSSNGYALLNTSKVLEGIYYVQIESGRTKTTKTVVINHR